MTLQRYTTFAAIVALIAVSLLFGLVLNRGGLFGAASVPGFDGRIIMTNRASNQEVAQKVVIPSVTTEQSVSIP